MKHLAETLQNIGESILNIDAINNKIEKDVEWRDMLSTAAGALTKSIKMEHAWAYEVARFTIASHLFTKYQSKETPGVWATRFAAFMEYTLNPFIPMNVDLDDVESLYDLESVCWEKMPSYNKTELVRVCQEIADPKSNYRKRLGSSGSFYEYFFPSEIRDVYETWYMENHVLVTKYKLELQKLIKIAGIDK